MLREKHWVTIAIDGLKRKTGKKLFGERRGGGTLLTVPDPLYPSTDEEKMIIDKFHSLTFRLTNSEAITEASRVIRMYIDSQLREIHKDAKANPTM